MELWDVYDKYGGRTGRTHPRGEPMAPGDYHLIVSVIVVNSRGEVFLTRRSAQKELCPGEWECPGGGALAGETSRQGAARELLEETGIEAQPGELVYLARRKGPDWYSDDYGLRRDFPIESVAFQPGETDAAQWMPLAEWEQKARAGELFATGYTEKLYAAVHRLAEGPGAGDKPAPAELSDIYDAEGNLTGRTHWRGADMAPGEYGLAVSAAICNSSGQVLCTLRSPEKAALPNVWESPGGSVRAGETSRQGMVRELWEETGITAREDELVFLHRRRTGDIFFDAYALHRDMPASEVRLQEGETAGARWFPIDEWERLARQRVILAGDYTDAFFEAVRRLADSVNAVNE